MGVVRIANVLTQHEKKYVMGLLTMYLWWLDWIALPATVFKFIKGWLAFLMLELIPLS